MEASECHGPCTMETQCAVPPTKKKFTEDNLAPEYMTSVSNAVDPLILSDNDYRKLMELLEENFERGLKKETRDQACIKMIPSYVRAVPDGTERGEYLALDLGGTNFRVLLISLHGGKEMSINSDTYLIPQKIMTGTGTGLFDYVADCCFKFVIKHGLQGKRLPLGFTFSFPCHQTGLNEAVLTGWTKGFNCSDTIGHDVCKMLNDALSKKQGVEIDCLAIINDTVGTLMSCASEDPKCAIGLILGTGTNASYIEKVDNVELMDGDNSEPREVLIDTEWEYFGDDGCLDFITTEYDVQVDKTSVHIGEFTYEKMISGMYLGEIARLVIEKLRQNGQIFEGNGSEELSTYGRFYAKYISEIVVDKPGRFSATRQILTEELHIDDEVVTDTDCKITQYVCSVVSKRAAYLAAAGIACLLNKINRPEVTVGIDGSLYKYHPQFHTLMESKIKELVKPGIQFKLKLAHDGSGKGAAFVAAVADKLRTEKAESKHQ